MPQASPPAVAAQATGEAEGLLSDLSFVSVFFDCRASQSCGSDQKAKTEGAPPAEQNDESEKWSSWAPLLFAVTPGLPDNKPLTLCLPGVEVLAGPTGLIDQSGNQREGAATKGSLAEPKAQQGVPPAGFEALPPPNGAIAFTAVVAESVTPDDAASAVSDTTLTVDRTRLADKPRPVEQSQPVERQQPIEKPQPIEQRGPRGTETTKAPSRAAPGTQETELSTPGAAAPGRAVNELQTAAAAPSHVPTRDADTAAPVEKSAAPKSAQAVEPVLAASQRDKGPIDVSIRLNDAQHRSAEVRLVERGGELRVSVRSANPELVQSLRSGLDDLATRLETSGVKAQVFQPAVAAAASPADPRQSSSENGSGGRQFGEPGGQEQRQQRQPDQRDQQAQDREDDFKSTLRGWISGKAER